SIGIVSVNRIPPVVGFGITLDSASDPPGVSAAGPGAARDAAPSKAAAGVTVPPPKSSKRDPEALAHDRPIRPPTPAKSGTVTVPSETSLRNTCTAPVASARAPSLSPATSVTPPSVPYVFQVEGGLNVDTVTEEPDVL